MAAVVSPKIPFSETHQHTYSCGASHPGCEIIQSVYTITVKEQNIH